MPDGKPGFSMMLIITAEFPPIQLGYGFTLNGVGGAVGINRTMDEDFLSNGIHTGALESILFPPDPVAHANEVISNIKQGFPLAEGRFIFGPMLKVGWASVISIEAGVLLELPMPIKLALLGRLSCVLPEADSAILVLQLDLAGFIDFGTGDIKIDADLVDSRIVTFPLTGGFAVRANVGNNPTFALSAGGFHPRFTPPPNFPKLARIGLAIGSDNPHLRLESYFAVTTNTVQTGARADFYAAADFGVLGSFSASADLGFDGLIHFTPFQLEVEIYGSAEIKRNGDDLCSADLDLLLTGPEPWHARGHATVHYMGDHTLGFDRTFGPDAPPQSVPATNVAALVRAAVGDPGSWGAVPPSGDHSLVTLRDIGANNGLLLHPRAELTVHQRVAPIDTPLGKYGNGPIDGPSTISIDSVTVPGIATQSVGTLDDDFAPAQYFQLTDDQKLSSPAFEKLPAGRTVDLSSFKFWSGEKADQHYVTITIDDPTLLPTNDGDGALGNAHRASDALKQAMAELIVGASPRRIATSLRRRGSSSTSRSTQSPDGATSPRPPTTPATRPRRPRIWTAPRGRRSIRDAMTADYTYFPYARTALSSAVTTADTPAADPFVKLSVGAVVNGTASGTVDLRLAGPGEIRGLDRRVVLRTDPVTALSGCRRSSSPRSSCDPQTCPGCSRRWARAAPSSVPGSASSSRTSKRRASRSSMRRSRCRFSMSRTSSRCFRIPPRPGPGPTWPP